MASFKGDSNYTAYHDHSDHHSDDAEEDMHVDLKVTQLDERAWLRNNYEAIEYLYNVYLTVGRELFGTAFFQMGGFNNFAAFVYNNTHPGPNH